MNLRRILTAAAVTAALFTAAPAQAHIMGHGCNSKQAPKVELACAKRNLYHAQFTIQWAKEQRRMVLYSPVQKLHLTHIITDHRWLYFESKRDIAEAKLRMPIPLTYDFLTAVENVQRAWPGSSWWITECSSSEGGHGGFVMNRQGSGAGGWMQYMVGTFYHDYDAAVDYARRYHLQLPPSGTRDWHSPLGQAYAAGWAYGHDRPSGKWTGAKC